MIDNRLLLYHVTVADRGSFYLVTSADNQADLARQLAKALGLAMTDLLPKFEANLIDEPIKGRVRGREIGTDTRFRGGR